MRSNRGFSLCVDFGDTGNKAVISKALLHRIPTLFNDTTAKRTFVALMENISRDKTLRQNGSVVYSAPVPEVSGERRTSHLADKMSLFQTEEPHQRSRMLLPRLEIIYLLHSGRGHVATATLNPKCTCSSALNISPHTTGVFSQR